MDHADAWPHHREAQNMGLRFLSESNLFIATIQLTFYTHLGYLLRSVKVSMLFASDEIRLYQMLSHYIRRLHLSKIKVWPFQQANFLPNDQNTPGYKRDQCYHPQAVGALLDSNFQLESCLCCKNKAGICFFIDLPGFKIIEALL